MRTHWPSGGRTSPSSGAPFDINTTYRAGARFGPRALRSQAYDPGTYHLDLGLDIFEWLDVVDAGDAYCPHGQSARSHRNIESKVTDVLKAGAFPVVIGGDHSITYPSATAVARKYGWGKVGLLHFDAHADTADSIEGNLHSHGTPMRRLIESGAIRGRNFVQVGLRGYWPPPEVFDWMREQEMTWHLMHDVWDRGMRPVIADAIARAGDGCDWLYLSVDIDVLDPGFAPGTGTPEPGGMNPADLLARRPVHRPGDPARRARRCRGVPAVRPRRDHGERRAPGGAGDDGRAGREEAGEGGRDGHQARHRAGPGDPPVPGGTG